MIWLITIGGNWLQPTYDAINPGSAVSLMGIPYSSDEKEKMISYIWWRYILGCQQGFQESLIQLKSLSTGVTSDEGQECMTKTLG